VCLQFFFWTLLCRELKKFENHWSSSLPGSLASSDFSTITESQALEKADHRESSMLHLLRFLPRLEAADVPGKIKDFKEVNSNKVTKKLLKCETK
jgi:hypothetical protein